jgi:N-methylhydantoinase B
VRRPADSRGQRGSRRRGARRRPLALPDPVTREIIKGALRAAQAEMEAVIERTAMSPFIREKKDYFAGILDREGHVVCGTAIPLFGNLTWVIFEQYPPATMRPGDLYWYNDCHGSRGGVSHSPDMVFAAPVFHDGELVAFSQTWGHFWDIGGLRAGSISPDATEIFHEGIIVPAIRIYRQGRLNDEAFRIFLRNSRFPDILRGDIRAVLAGCRLGERRIQELFARFGAATVRETWALFAEQGGETIRKTLRARIPDGTYESEDAVDGDGMTGRPYYVRMRMEKRGDRISIDTRASDDQARGPINFIMHESVPKLIVGIYVLSGHPTQLLNHGAQEAIDEVLVRPGSILQPNWPAALGNRAHTLARVQSNVLALLALATGGDVPAANSVYNIYFLRGVDPATREFFLCSDGVAVGYGARPFADGLDAIYYVAQKNYPAEFLEMVFPMRLRQYALHQDSGGPGLWRGGVGVVREVELLADEAVVALRQDNVLFPPAGVNGGHAGRPGRAMVNPGRPDQRDLASMSDGNVLHRGDILRLYTSGGGGWGHPFDRPLERVRRDVVGGFVSTKSAREDYGVVIDETGVVDVAATARRRAADRGPVRMFHRAGYFGPLTTEQQALRGAARD